MNNKIKLVLFCVVICILTSCIRVNIILDDKDLYDSKNVNGESTIQDTSYETETYETPTVAMKEDIKEENTNEKYELSDAGMKINSANKKILSSLEKLEKGNIVFSNAGIQAVLKMAELAAVGDTKKEITDVNGSFDKNLNSKAVNIYNYMTVNEMQNDVKAKKEYIEALQNDKNIKADLYEIHKYEGIDYVVNDINERIKKETNGQIENGIDPNEYKNKDFVMQLGNVIHFLGTWDKVTKEEPYRLKNIYFKNKSGEEVATDFVVINQNDGRLVENNDIIGLTLDYKEESKRYKFLIFLPKDEKNFNIDSINAESINYFTGMQYRLNAKFPKFEFDNDMNLTSIIEALGIKDLFSKQYADLSNGFDYDKNILNVYASSINQKSVIRVDEIGTEASALTTIDMMKTTAAREPRKVKVRKVDLTFNRPFYFMIYDRNEDMPLFIGKINELEDNGKEVLEEDKNIPTIIDEVIEEEQY